MCGPLLGSAAAGAPASPAAGGAPVLRVEAEDGRQLLAVSLATDPDWVVTWNHSVTGVRVSDHYSYEDGLMLLTRSHTPAFDAGLGHIPGRGRVVSDGAHGYWILDLDEPVPGNGYWLRVGSPRVDHAIVHAGRRYSLSAEAAGLRVRVAVVDAAAGEPEAPGGRERTR